MQIEAYQNGIVSTAHGGARAGSGRMAGGKNKRGPAGADEVLRVLTSSEEKSKWRALVLAAEDNPKLMLEVLTRISELRRGKPFVATNPRERHKPAQDNRLMIAIQNMLPKQSAKTSEPKPARKRLNQAAKKLKGS